MHRLRSTSVCALSVLIFSISACMTTSKRLAEDLQTDGFTISLPEEEEGATGPIVTVSDTDSIERLTHWFHRRPHATDDQLTVKLMTELFSKWFPGTVRVETSRLRVDLPMALDLPVVLETRDTPANEWSKAVWKARKEDVVLHRWAIDRIKASLISQYEAEAATHVLPAAQAIPN